MGCPSYTRSISQVHEGIQHLTYPSLTVVVIETNSIQLNMLAAIFYCAATGFTKVSVLIFYLRIFPSKNFHIAVWTVVFIAVGYNIASVLANVFACTPIAKSWDLTIMNGACMNRSVFYFANAGLGIFTDFATVLVPIPWLAKLQMPLRQKVAIGVILAMGCLYVFSFSPPTSTQLTPHIFGKKKQLISA